MGVTLRNNSLTFLIGMNIKSDERVSSLKTELKNCEVFVVFGNSVDEGFEPKRLLTATKT